MNEFKFADYESIFYKKLNQLIWADLALMNEIVAVRRFEGNPSFQSLSEALLNEEINAAIFPLSMIPIEKPEGIVITALAKRHAAAEILLVRKEHVVENKLLKLKEGASVSVFTEMQKAQLFQFRPDLEITLLDWSYFFKNDDLNFETDGMILPVAFAEKFKHDHIEFPLQPSEFIPTPGQGVLAFLTLKNNLPIRRILKEIHQKEVSACTNIERGIQKALPYNVAAFCNKNSQGHFQVSAVSAKDGKLAHFKTASSTSLNMVEKCVSELDK